MAPLLFVIGMTLLALGFFQYGRLIGLLLKIISINMDWEDYDGSSIDETCVERGSGRNTYEVCYPNE